jgi:hypothetical protein
MFYSRHGLGSNFWCFSTILVDLWKHFTLIWSWLKMQNIWWLLHSLDDGSYQFMLGIFCIFLNRTYDSFYTSSYNFLEKELPSLLVRIYKRSKKWLIAFIWRGITDLNSESYFNFTSYQIWVNQRKKQLIM